MSIKMSCFPNWLLCKKILFVQFILTLLSYLMWLSNSTSLFVQGITLILAVSSTVVSLITLHISRTSLQKKYIVLLIGSGTLIIIGICWNSLFLLYINITGYEKDVFRGFLQVLHAPIYGISQWSRWPWNFLLISFSSIFVIRVICWQKTWIESRGLIIELLMWFVSFIIIFALSDGLERLVGIQAHYGTFASDKFRFEGVSHTLRTYTQVMSQLSVHNAHYPPGNLLLMIVGENIGLLWFGKAVVISLTVMTFLPMYGILSELQVAIYTRYMALILFISSPVILSLPSVAMTPIPMFLATTIFWLMLVAIRRESMLYSALVGFVIAIYSYFSFTSIIIGLLLLLISVTQICVNDKKPSYFLKSGFVAMVIFLIFCYLFYFFTGFNLFLSLMKGIEHNRNLMAPGYDSLLRYLLRSTGNLIAWMCGIGFVSSTFGSLAGMNALRYPLEADRGIVAFNIAIFVTVLLTAFSTLFFLETERIWLFFVPLWVIVAAIGIGQVPERHKIQFLKNLLIFSILFAVGQELVFQPFTW